MIRRVLVLLWLSAVPVLLGCDSNPSTRPAQPLELDSLLVDISFPPGQDEVWVFRYAQRLGTRDRSEEFSFFSVQPSGGQYRIPYDPSGIASLLLDHPIEMDTVATWTVSVIRERQDGSQELLEPVSSDPRQVRYTLLPEGEPRFSVHEVPVTVVSTEAEVGDCPGADYIYLFITSRSETRSLGDITGIRRWSASQRFGGNTRSLRMTAPSVETVRVIYTDEARPLGVRLLVDGVHRELTCYPNEIATCPGVTSYICTYTSLSPETGPGDGSLGADSDWAPDR